LKRLVGLVGTHAHRAAGGVGAPQLALHRLTGLPHELPHLRIGGADGSLCELGIDVIAAVLCAAEGGTHFEALAVAMGDGHANATGADVDRGDVALRSAVMCVPEDDGCRVDDQGAD